MRKLKFFILFVLFSFFCAGYNFNQTQAITNTKYNSDQTQTITYKKDSLFAMNTYMSFIAYGENAQSALEESKQKIQVLEQTWSVTNENSEIYQANHSMGKTITVSQETAELLAFTLQMAQKTHGALEPTIYPVLTLWGFTTNEKHVPTQEQITKELKNVGYQQIQLEGAYLTVPTDVQLDIGAVGKGFTADIITEIMKEHGIESAAISLGGNIQVIGSRPDGSDWHVGVQDPMSDGNLGILEISDAAVVTSGGYENYFEDEYGNVYWHILNPYTGYPADSGLKSVTIISKEGKLSDALSTAIFVMGEEKAKKFWRENDGFDMLLITDENKILLTEGITDRFSLNEEREEIIQMIEK